MVDSIMSVALKLYQFDTDIIRNNVLDLLEASAIFRVPDDLNILTQFPGMEGRFKLLFGDQYVEPVVRATPLGIVQVRFEDQEVKKSLTDKYDNPWLYCLGTEITKINLSGATDEMCAIVEYADQLKHKPFLLYWY